MYRKGHTTKVTIYCLRVNNVLSLYFCFRLLRQKQSFSILDITNDSVSGDIEALLDPWTASEKKHKKKTKKEKEHSNMVDTKIEIDKPTNGVELTKIGKYIGLKN